MGPIIGIGGSIHDFAACLIDENDQVRAIAGTGGLVGINFDKAL